MNKIPVLKIKDEKGNLIPINALRGASAYEQAVEGGYKGTKEEFLAFLNGLTNDASHYNNTDNPHKVTKEQVGLGNISTDENGNIVCENGLKMFKDFSMQGWTYDWVEDEAHEDGGYYLYTAINGPFSPTVKIAEIGCGLDGGAYIRDGFYLCINETYGGWEYVDEIFPPEYFDYEIQPTETITEAYYDVFCEGKFILRSDGRVYSLNSELQDLSLSENPSNIVDGWVLYDDYSEIPLKVIVTSTVDKLKAYQEHLKSLENGGGEE